MAERKTKVLAPDLIPEFPSIDTKDILDFEFYNRLQIDLAALYALNPIRKLTALRCSSEGRLYVETLGEKTPINFLSYPQEQTITLASGTAAGTSNYVSITPAAGQLYRITYLRLITDAEVTGNVEFILQNGNSFKLLTSDQDESLDKVYDVKSLYDTLEVAEIRLHITSKVDLTADRTNTLHYCGYIVST